MALSLPNPPMNWLANFHFGANEQKIMQSLNDRLGAYLAKAKRLDLDKKDLEEKISGWYKNQKTQFVDSEDKEYAKYIGKIEDLREKLSEASSRRDTLQLEVENIKQQAENYSDKYETLLSYNQTIQNEIAGLHGVKDATIASEKNLKEEQESLTNALKSIKQDYEKELKEIKVEFGEIVQEGDVSIGVDFNEILKKMRDDYEYMVESNRREVEKWYTNMMVSLNTEITTTDKDVIAYREKVSELTRTLQNLQIKLQSLYSQKKNLEDQLVVEESHFGAEIYKLQINISDLEKTIQKYRSDFELQINEFNQLLNIKNRLEKEIIQYRELLGKFTGPSFATYALGYIPPESTGIPKEPKGFFENSEEMESNEHAVKGGIQVQTKHEVHTEVHRVIKGVQVQNEQELHAVIKGAELSPASIPPLKKEVRIKKIVEDVVDGKIVSSQVVEQETRNDVK